MWMSCYKLLVQMICRLLACKQRVGNAISVKTLVRQSPGLPDPAAPQLLGQWNIKCAQLRNSHRWSFTWIRTKKAVTLSCAEIQCENMAIFVVKNKYHQALIHLSGTATQTCWLLHKYTYIHVQVSALQINVYEQFFRRTCQNLSV